MALPSPPPSSLSPSITPSLPHSFLLIETPTQICSCRFHPVSPDQSNCLFRRCLPQKDLQLHFLLPFSELCLFIRIKFDSCQTWCSSGLQRASASPGGAAAPHSTTAGGVQPQAEEPRLPRLQPAGLQMSILLCRGFICSF